MQYVAGSFDVRAFTLIELLVVIAITAPAASGRLFMRSNEPGFHNLRRARSSLARLGRLRQRFALSGLRRVRCRPLAGILYLHPQSRNELVPWLPVRGLPIEMPVEAPQVFEFHQFRVPICKSHVDGTWHFFPGQNIARSAGSAATAVSRDG